MIHNLHQCEYCSATFVNERNLLKHSCKYKERFRYITKKKRGIAMYAKYLHWLKKSGKSTRYVDQHTFIHSTQYNHFDRFLQFASEKGIPDIDLYIEVMIKKDLPPQHWIRDDVLKFFLDYYDHEINPKVHISKSVDTLFRLSDAIGCETGDIFNELDNKTILILLQSRKLSPWLLLNSDKFREYLRYRASAKERDYIQQYINPLKWKKIMKKNTKLLKDIQLILKEFEL